MNIFFTIFLAGIFCCSAGLAFSFPFLNLIGSIAMLIGIFKLPIQGAFAKKAKMFSIIAVPFTALACGLLYLNSVNPEVNFTSVFLGICVFFYIYVTYYFTEALIEHAKFINELAITRNFRSIWTLCGVVAFLFFMAVMSNLIPLIINIAGIIVLISALFYCFSISSSAKILFKNKK